MAEKPTSEESTKVIQGLLVTPSTEGIKSAEEFDDRYYKANPWAEKYRKTS
jgi:hypothetical protein